MGEFGCFKYQQRFFLVAAFVGEILSPASASPVVVATTASSLRGLGGQGLSTSRSAEGHPNKSARLAKPNMLLDQHRQAPSRRLPTKLNIDVSYDTTQFEVEVFGVRKRMNEASVARDLASTLSGIGPKVDPETLKNFLENLLYSHEAVYGSVIAFEPDSYPCSANGTGSDACTLGLLEGGVPSGSGYDEDGNSTWTGASDPWTLPILEISDGDYAALYAPYGYRGGDWQEGMEFKFMDLGDGYNYWDGSVEWFHAARTLFLRGELNFTQGYWSDPYFDEGAGNVNMVTYSVPFWRSTPVPARPQQDVSDETLYPYGLPTNEAVTDWSGRQQYFWGIATIDLVLESLTFNCGEDEVYDYDQKVCRQCDPGSERVEEEGTAPYCVVCEAGSYGLGGLSSCTACPLGQYQASTGASDCASCPSGMTTGNIQMVRGSLGLLEVEGATSSSFCNCIQGTTSFVANSANGSQPSCTTCGEGLSCVGGNRLELLSGFWSPADEPFSIFYCDVASACPGGEPGSCSAKRSTESLGCSSCVSGYRERNDGSCQACEGWDFLWMPSAALFVLLFLASIYALAATERSATQLRSTLLGVLTISQVVTLLQYLTVMDSMSVQWPDPLDRILQSMAVLAFDIDRLEVSCFMGLAATINFSIRLFMVLGLFEVLLIIHLLMVFLRFDREFWAKRSILYGSTGTLFITILVPIMTTVIAPLQCHKHPNGLSTIWSYPTVVCWDDVYDSPHSGMVALSLSASILPCGVIAGIAVAVYLLPRKLQEGDTHFLQCTTCLFYRFRVQTHWYVLVFVVKSLLVTLIPVIPDPASQIILMSVILMGSMLLVVAAHPWRVMEGNALDVGASLAMLMVLMCAAFFVEDVSAEAWASFAVVLIGASAALLMSVVVWSVHQRFRRKRKTYQLFLCHHKEAAGNFARLLKMNLTEKAWRGCGVFLDSDNLSDLAALYNIVRSEVDTLVVLCSSKIFHRSWCVGEVTIATINRVNRVGVALDGYEGIDVDFIENFDQYVTDWRPLAEHGISLELAQAALRDFVSVYIVSAPVIATRLGMEKVAISLVERGRASSFRPVSSACGAPAEADVSLQTNIESTSSAGSGNETTPRHGPQLVALVGLDSVEAFCAKLVIKKSLPPLVGSLALYLAARSELLPQTVAVVLACSNGIFGSAPVLRLLWKAYITGLNIIPVTIEPTFRFPTSQLEHELEGVSFNETFDVDELAEVLREVFKGIAIHINPQDHIDVLKASVDVLHRRLVGQEAQLAGKGFISSESERRKLSLSGLAASKREANTFLAIKQGLQVSPRPTSPGERINSPSFPEEEEEEEEEDEVDAQPEMEAEVDELEETEWDVDMSEVDSV